MKILFLSHTPDNGVFKVGSHHLARELSKASLSVAHISTPRSLVHKALGKGGAGEGNTGVLDEFGTLHVVPNLILPIQFAKAGRALGNVVKKFGFDDADYILVDQPLMAGYVESNRPKGRVVYRPTDTYTTIPAASRQSRLVNAVDGVVATSDAVLQSLKLRDGVPRLVLENGVELARFMLKTPFERSGFVYVGAVDYRFDWESVLAVAEANPTERIEIIGPVSRGRDHLPTNISLLGSIPYEMVPGYLNRARVGLIPLNATDVNQGRSPMKYYEYLASGLSVLATSTPSLRERHTSQTFLFHGPGDVGGLSTAALSADSPNLRGLQESIEQDWSAKASTLLSFLKSL